MRAAKKDRRIDGWRHGSDLVITPATAQRLNIERRT
jgi:hypothetical protein